MGEQEWIYDIWPQLIKISTCFNESTGRSGLQDIKKKNKNTVILVLTKANGSHYSF